MVRHKMKHERYSRLMAKMQRAAPPSIASLDEESTNGWLDEADVPESDSSASLSIMPDVTCEAPAIYHVCRNAAVWVLWTFLHVVAFRPQYRLF